MPHIQDLFDSKAKGRDPKVVVAPDGSVLAFRSCAELRRSEDAGETWSAPVALSKGGGNVIVDEAEGEVLVVRPAAQRLLRSRDNGLTWEEETIAVKPNAIGHGVPGNAPIDGNASESGVVLRHGEHPGRLLMPGRIQPPNGDNAQESWPYNYNAAMFSDDRGRTWQVSEPVQSGTGEGTLAEMSDGSIYYNSRCHMAVDARRRIAWSHDGGHRWVDWQVCDTLKEVGEPFYFKYGTKPSYGCNAGLTRVPLEATDDRDVLLYCAPDNPGGTRVRMSVWASFDRARTWSLKRLVYGGPSAYSSITADKGGNVYLLFQRGMSANPRRNIRHLFLALARFDLDWVLAG